jgi:hypothetical protein
MCFGWIIYFVIFYIRYLPIRINLMVLLPLIVFCSIQHISNSFHYLSICSSKHQTSFDSKPKSIDTDSFQTEGSMCIHPKHDPQWIWKLPKQSDIGSAILLIHNFSTFCKKPLKTRLLCQMIKKWIDTSHKRKLTAPLRYCTWCPLYSMLFFKVALTFWIVNCIPNV